MKTVPFAMTVFFCANGLAAPEATDDRCKNADSGSYSAISLCGQSKFEEADAKLNEAYKKLLTVLNEDKPRRKLVVESQRAWLVYRDKSCEYWSGLVSYQVSWCRFGITEQRLEELNHMYGCVAEGASQC